METSDSIPGQKKVMAEGCSINQNDDDCTAIVTKIDGKMGAGWARKFANVLAAGMTLEAEVIFTFEKFNSGGEYKYSSKRKYTGT